MLRKSYTWIKKALILSIICSPVARLLSTNFQWNSTVDTTWENPANWIPDTAFPDTSNDTANFLNGAFANPAISSDITINSINFSGNAYTLLLNPLSDLEVQGSVNSNTSIPQNVFLDSAAMGFNGIASSASDGVGTGGVAYSLADSSMDFRSNSSASDAMINLLSFSPSSLTFHNSSSAGSASIVASPLISGEHQITFEDNSTSALASISGNTVNLVYEGLASSGSSIINLTDSTISFASANNASSATVQASGTDVSISGEGTAVSAMQLTFDVGNSVASSLQISADAKVGFLSTDALSPITLTSGTLTFGDTSNTTLAGEIQGPGNLQKVGSGTAILTGTNSNTGVTTVTQGTLQGTTVSLPNNIVDNAKLEFNQPISGTYAGQLSGGGVVEVEGGQTITFTGNSSGFTGTTNVVSTELKMGISGQIGGSVNLTDEAQFTLNHSQTLTSLTSDPSSSVNLNNLELTLNLTGPDQIDGPITGTGGILNVQGTGVLFLDGENTYSGITKVGPNATVVGTTTSVQGDIFVEGLVDFDQTVNGSYNGQLSGTGTVNFEGGATYTFTGNSSGFEGQTNVIASTLESGPTGEWGGNVALSQQAAFVLNNDQTLLSLTSDETSVVNLNDNTLVLQPVGTDQITGKINGTGGSLVMDGPGTLILSGKNSFTGLLTILNGIVQGDTNSLSSDVLNESLLNINQNFTGDFNNIISGDGTLVINGSGGTGTVILTGDNTYTGGTQLVGGTLQISSDSNLGALYDPVNASNAILNFAQSSTLQAAADLDIGRPIIIGTFVTNAIATIDTQNFTVEVDGNISDLSSVGGGVGALVKKGSGRLILEGDNSYSGGTLIADGTIEGNTNSIQGNIIDEGTLDFRQSFDGEYSGNISGSGDVVFDGTGTITLSGDNSYTGGTLISSGTVIGNTSSLQGDIIDHSELIFEQDFDGIFIGHLIGDGLLEITGSGRLIFAEENHHFRGSTLIERGHLALEAFLGGDVVVGNLGILSGRGTVGRSLSIGSGGTIAPGKHVLHVLGDFIQYPDSTYVVELERFEKSSLLDVRGTATIFDGTTLNIISIKDGRFNPNVTYQILYARDGLHGKYSVVLIDNPMIFPELTYTPTNIFLRTSPKFSVVTTTSNQQAVADQFEMEGTKLTESQEKLLVDLLNLPAPDVERAFDQMSAAQYAMLPVAAEFSTHQFIRRLYDPLRMLIATRPPLDPCDCCSCLDDTNVDIWGEISFNKANFKGSCQSKGCSISDYEVSIGAQKRLNNRWTLGVAASYDHSTLHFDLGGNGSQTTALGAVYGLYRPINYYFLADLVFGATSGRVKRPISLRETVSNANGHSNIFQGAAYAELGRDWIYSSFLIQPFAGMEIGFYNTSRVHENGAGLFNVNVRGELNYSVLSSLGLHISTVEENTEMLLGLDLAWLCRLTTPGTGMRANFRQFGTIFNVNGPSFNRNSFEITASLSKPINPIWDLYADFTGRLWAKASTYSFVVGLKAKW